MLAAFAFFAPTEGKAERDASFGDLAHECIGHSKGPLDLDCVTEPAAEDLIFKTLPAGLTMRTLTGEMFKTTKPTVVRFVQKRPSGKIGTKVQGSNLQYCNGLSRNGQAFLGETGFDESCEFKIRTEQKPSVKVLPKLEDRSHLAETILKPKTTEPLSNIDQSELWQFAPDLRPVVRTNTGLDSTRDTAQADVMVKSSTGKRSKYIPTKVASRRGPAVTSPCERGVERVPVSKHFSSSDSQAEVGLRYVQVGAFGVEANAAETIKCLSDLGFPVSSQPRASQGAVLKIILAGPFETSQAAVRARDQIRAIGYSDAFARK